MAGRRLHLPAAALALGALLVAGAASAEGLYRYVDEDGNVHFVDEPSKAGEDARVEAVDPAASDVNVVPDGGGAGVRAREPGATREPRCELRLRNRTRRSDGRDLVYSGQVVNLGTGRASGVELELVDLDAAGNRLESYRASLASRSLDPREATGFEVVVRRADRDEMRASTEFERSTFRASFARCR